MEKQYDLIILIWMGRTVDSAADIVATIKYIIKNMDLGKSDTLYGTVLAAEGAMFY